MQILESWLEFSQMFIYIIVISDSQPSLAKMMAWCQIGAKPLSKPMVT